MGTGTFLKEEKYGGHTIQFRTVDNNMINYRIFDRYGLKDSDRANTKMEALEIAKKKINHWNNAFK